MSKSQSAIIIKILLNTHKTTSLTRTVLFICTTSANTPKMMCRFMRSALDHLANSILHFVWRAFLSCQLAVYSLVRKQSNRKIKNANKNGIFFTCVVQSSQFLHHHNTRCLWCGFFDSLDTRDEFEIKVKENKKKTRKSFYNLQTVKSKLSANRLYFVILCRRKYVFLEHFIIKYHMHGYIACICRRQGE